MAVAVQNLATSGSSNPPATSFLDSKLTVSAGTNLAVVVGVTWLGNPGALGTFNWDASGGTPQAMTLIGSVTPISGSSVFLGLFGVVNPHVGNLDLSGSWTNSVSSNDMMLSLTGVNQSGGSSSFSNFNSATGTTSPSSLSVTNPSGALAIDLIGFTNVVSAPTQTIIFSTNSGVGLGMSEGTSNPTVTFGWTVSNSWGDIGMAVLPPASIDNDGRGMNIMRVQPPGWRWHHKPRDFSGWEPRRRVLRPRRSLILPDRSLKIPRKAA